MLLEGLHIPLTTPFHPDGRLNLPKLAANVARYSKSPAAGLLVLGPSGEPSLLSDEETREILRIAVEAAAPEKVLIAGISRDSVHATLALANFAAKQNYDAILVGLPSILSRESRATVEDRAATAVGEQAHPRLRRELLLYFQALADRSPLPLVLFSDHARGIPPDAVVELAAHPRILGLLDAESRTADLEARTKRSPAIRREVAVTSVFAAVTARMTQAAPASFVSAKALGARPPIAQTASTAAAALTREPTPPAQTQAPLSHSLRARTKSVGFQILAGNTQTIFDSLNAGAVGAAPAFAACAPQACYEILAAWKDQDRALAAEKQSRLAEAATRAEAAPGSLKFACDLNGYCGGVPRMPHLPPTGEQRADIQRLMRPLRT